MKGLSKNSPILAICNEYFSDQIARKTAKNFLRRLETKKFKAHWDKINPESICQFEEETIASSNEKQTSQLLANFEFTGSFQIDKSLLFDQSGNLLTNGREYTQNLYQKYDKNLIKCHIAIKKHQYNGKELKLWASCNFKECNLTYR